MLLAAQLTTIQIIGIIIFCVLLVQWGLAFFCIMRLYRNKPRILKMWKWNIIVLFGVWVGPICYLLLEKANPRYQVSEQQSTEGDDYSI